MSDSIQQINKDRQTFILTRTKKTKIKKNVKKDNILANIPINISVSIPETILPKEPDLEVEEKKKVGYVYFIYMPEHKDKNLFKIGQTMDIKRRIKSLQTGNPFKLEYYKIIKTIKHKVLELEFHKRLSNKNVLLEWFNITTEDINNLINEIIKNGVLEKMNTTIEDIEEENITKKLENINLIDDYDFQSISSETQ